MATSLCNLLVRLPKYTRLYKKLATTLLLCFCFASCSDSLYRETRVAMHTTTTITVSTADKDKAKQAIQQAFVELQRLEKLLNYYDSTSEISMINQNAGLKPVQVSPETFEIIKQALYVSKVTDGSFDITSGRLIALWDFKNKKIPPLSQITEAKKLSGYHKIELDETAKTVFIKQKSVEINLGGIIKGYSAQKAAEVLKSHGIKAGLVAVAGDIAGFGLRPDGHAWRIAIKNPRPANAKDEIIAVVSLDNESISTSGDYERFFELDGKRYHHIIDPKTGFPSEHCRSVTVIAHSGAYADAFATGLCVLPHKTALQIANKLKLGAIIIDSQNNLHITDNLQGKVVIKKSSP